MTHKNGGYQFILEHVHPLLAHNQHSVHFLTLQTCSRKRVMISHVYAANNGILFIYLQSEGKLYNH